MKRSLCVVLMLSILVSMMSGVVFVSADEAAATTSTLNEIFSFDMNGETNYNEFVSRYQLYHGSSTKGSQVLETASGSIGNVYGIGDYYGATTSVALPLGTVQNANGQFDGIKKTGTPNFYIEAEFDYAVNPHPTSSDTSGGVGATFVTYADATSTELLSAGDNYGSVYHEYYSDGTVKFFRTKASTEITGVEGKTKKWYRCKIVSQLTDENGNFKSSGNATHVFIDGVKVASYSHKTKAISNTNDYVSFFRIHQSDGRAYLDNLTVRTYQSGDAPVEKGALVAAIRNFEEQNPDYTEYPAAVELIDSAKATYENASATPDDVTAAIANVNNAGSAMVPYTVVKSYDFEDNYDAYLASLRSNYTDTTSGFSNGQNTDNDVYAIGKYESRSSSFLIPLTDETETVKTGTTGEGDEATDIMTTVPKGIKIEGENLYVQTEFDYKVLDSTPQSGKSYSAGGMLLTGFRNDKNPYVLFDAQKAFGTIYHQYEPAADENSSADAVFTTYSHTSTKASATTGPYIADAAVNKWQRIKIVTQVTNSEGEMHTNNTINFYVDGEPVKTAYLNSEVVSNSDGYIRFLRQHLSYGKQAIDNISVVTYRGAGNAPVDKGGLVAAIRNFEADYSSYTSSERAVGLINAAKAVYEDSNASKERVDEAIVKVNTARSIFNPTEGMAVYLSDDKIIVNGTFTCETAIDENYRTMLAYYDEDDNLLHVEMTQPAEIAEGGNPIYLEGDVLFPYQRVTAYTWTTDTYTPLCKSASETVRALKVLSIGNSFSEDGMQYLYNIAEESGQFDAIILGIAYNGGCSINEHLEYINNNEAKYKYEKNTSGKWVSTNDVTLDMIIKDEKWSLITLQQNSANSGLADTYSNLPELIEYVNNTKLNPYAKLAWQMTWAYSEAKLDEGTGYDKDQMTMYKAIVSAVQSEILTNDDISFVIPSGTTIQNLRTSNVVEEAYITRDGQHLGYRGGRFAASLTWFKKITGLSIDDITFVPDDTTDGTDNENPELTADIITAIKASVNSAVATPYSVTQYNAQ